MQTSTFIKSGLSYGWLHSCLLCFIFPKALSVHLNACSDANFMIFLNTHELTHFVPFSILHFKRYHSRTHLRKRKIQGKQNHYWFLVYPLRKTAVLQLLSFYHMYMYTTPHIMTFKLLAKCTADYVFKIQKDSVFGKLFQITYVYFAKY